MGTIPSREASPTFFSLRYGTHEVGLIPLVYRYFYHENKELRQQFIRVRNDPSVRYSYMRSPEYGMNEIPPATFTEEKLDKLLDVIDETLYATTEAMLADEEAPIRPVPCAVCFVYLNGREGSDCFSFHGRRINIIGHFGCYTSEEKNEVQPYLHLQKTILKAAGDRTLERVVTLAAKVLCEGFTRATMTLRPTQNALDMFQRRMSLLPFISKAPWNSYPTLKFLYDAAALFWALDELREAGESPRFSSYEVKEGGEGGLVMELSGKLLVRSICWMCSLLSPSALRGSWEQFMLDEFRSQQKEKALAHWVATVPEVKHFMGGEEFTARVQNHLSSLLGEVVRARETPCEDNTLWREEQEYSHDHKLYRIFDSPICGPFLTTVKNKVEKKGLSGGSISGSDASSDRRPSGMVECSMNFGNETGKKDILSSNGASAHCTPSKAPNTRLPPPKYQDIVNSMHPPVYAQQPHVNACPMAMSMSTNSITPPLPPLMMISPLAAMKPFPTNANTPPASPTFLPVFQGPLRPGPFPVQSFGMPYVLVAPSGQAQQQPNIIGVNSNGDKNVVPQVALAATAVAAAAAGNNVNLNGGGTGTLYDPMLARQASANDALFAGGPMDQVALLDVGFPQTLRNYLLLPDGRIGLLNNAPGPRMNFWN